MQFSIEQDTLSRAIAQVLGVVDKRGTMPILSHCLLETDGNGVFVSATDLEIGFRGYYPAEVAQSGTLTVKADFLSKIIKELPKGTLGLLGTDNAGLQIQTGNSLYQLYGLPGEQFPDLPKAADDNLVEIEGRLLQEMILKTIFSVATDEKAYHLRGILWEQVRGDESNLLRLVSTDGHRLSLIERILPEGAEMALGNSIMVPYKAAREICHFVEGQEKVSLSLGEKTLALKVGNKSLSVRLLDRKFPDYRRIIPEEGFTYQFKINRQEIIGTLNRIMQLSNERFRAVIFKLTAESLEVSFQNADIGEGREVLPVSLEKGDTDELPLAVCFNARYIMEPLKAMGSDAFILEVNNSKSPCRFMGTDDPHYFGLIMPVSD